MQLSRCYLICLETRNLHTGVCLKEIHYYYCILQNFFRIFQQQKKNNNPFSSYIYTLVKTQSEFNLCVGVCVYVLGHSPLHQVRDVATHYTVKQILAHIIKCSQALN